MSGNGSRSKWLRRLAQAGAIAGVVIGLGATPGCMCRSRTYVPAGGVVVRRPARVVTTRPVVRTGPAVRVGAPAARPVARPAQP